MNIIKSTKLLLSTGIVLITVGFLIIIQNGSGNDSLIRTKDLGPTELNKRDRPDLAAQQIFDMTKDPALGYPPIARSVDAFKEIKKNFKAKRAIDGVVWQQRGPANIGGRTRAIMFDPNDPEAKKVWAGAIGGGLWYNNDITDPHSSWISVDDFMATLAISHITYDPTDLNTYYLATGQGYTSDIRGAGIWKSTDAGATWVQLESTNKGVDFYYVLRVGVTSNGTLLAATRTGLFRSTDGGENWEDVITVRMDDLEISDTKLYATSRIGGTVYVSEDDGVTWDDITPESGGERIEIGIAPSNSDVVYAIADGGSGSTDVEWMFRTTDGGETWTAMEIPNYLDQSCTTSGDHFTRGQAWFDLSIWVSPLDEDMVIVGGIDLHRSKDGGQTWEPISYWTGVDCAEYVHADQHTVAYRPGHPGAALFGHDGGVSYSENLDSDGLPEFEDRNKNYVTALFYSCAAQNEIQSNIFLAGAQDNGTQRFTQFGLNNTREATGGDGAFVFIDQNEPNIQISSYIRNTYQISVDGGLSFQDFSSGNDGSFINPADYDDNANILYAASGSGTFNVYSGISSEGASAITLTNFDPAGLSGNLTALKVSPHTDSVLFVGNSNGEVYKITDAASNPQATSIGSSSFPGGSSVSSVEVGANDDEILVTFSNYGVQSVWYTADGGENWSAIEGSLPDIPVNWALFNPSNYKQVLLATELGVWSSNDISAADPNWEPTNEGLANVKCTMLQYRDSDQMVVVSTFGRGLFTTDVFATTSHANFDTRQRVTYVGTPVTFADYSNLPNGDWSWDFGDGNTSVDQNPSHTYTAPGKYTVSLSINSSADTESKTDFITVMPVRGDEYAAADGGDFEADSEDFAAIALEGPQNLWERGVPGNTLTEVASGTSAWKTLLNSNIQGGADRVSALYTPKFQLASDVIYLLGFDRSMEAGNCYGPLGVKVEYTLDNGLTWSTLGDPLPVLGSNNWYDASERVDCTLINDVFDDRTGWALSTDGLVRSEYDISFLAGNEVAFRVLASVSNQFNETAYDFDGVLIDDFEIVKNPLPRAAFSVGASNVNYAGDDIQFTYLSYDPELITWDFGDGNTSNELNPVHSYESQGDYTITLTVSTAAGDPIDVSTSNISILPYQSGSYGLADGGNFEVNQTNFAADNITGTGWELGQSEIEGKSGTASGDFAWVTGINDTTYEDLSRAYLYTPKFDFSILGEYRIDFKANYQFEENWDGFIVEYSTDGDTWIKLNDRQEEGWYNSISDPASIFGESVPIFSGNTNNNFESYGTDVSFLSGEKEVSFRIMFQTDWASVDVGMALDDFEFTAPEGGAVTADFTVEDGGCVNNFREFTSTSTGGIVAASWDFGANAEPATAEGLGPHNVKYTAAGLSTVTLTLTDVDGNEIVETKTDFIQTGEVHTPSFTTQAAAGGGFLLTATAGDAYQWYLDDVAIDGATSQTYETTQAGEYSVRVTVNGCAQLSLSNIVTDSDGPLNSAFSVYPVPSNDVINFTLDSQYNGPVEVSIFSISGEELMKSTVNKSSFEFDETISIRDLGQGMFFLKIKAGNEFTKRFIKN